MLKQDVQNIHHVLTYPVLQRDDWADIPKAECMNSYAEHLSSENLKQNERQLELQPLCSLKNFDLYEPKASDNVSTA